MKDHSTPLHVVLKRCQGRRLRGKREGRSRGGKEEGGREMKQETVLNESNEMRLLRLDALGFETGKDRMDIVVSSSGLYIHPGSYRWS